MIVVRVREFGGPEVMRLEEAEISQPRPGQVLLKVEACGVNFADVMRRYDSYLDPTSLPYVPGMEAAGTVVKVGEGVNGIQEGDRVVGLTTNGAYAQYATLPAALISLLPAELSFAQAVALPVQGLTAYHILKTFGRLQPGESVLIHSAAGGVGMLAVQLAKLFGAGKVIAAASNPQKLELVQALGADAIIDYSQPGWSQQVRLATGGKGVDLVMEAVGGKIFEESFKCLASFGRIVTFGSSSSAPGEFNTLKLEIPALQTMKRGQSVTGFYLNSITNKPDMVAPVMNELLEMVLKQRIKINLRHAYALNEVVKAHTLLENRQTTGKLVLYP